METVPGIGERRLVIFLALPLEFPLRGPETCNPRRDLFALARQPVRLVLVHRPSLFLLSRPKGHWLSRLRRDFERTVAGLWLCTATTLKKILALRRRRSEQAE